MEPPDTTPPMIVSATPANMSKKASVIAPLVVTFDEDVDAASVSATTVHLEVDQVPHSFSAALPEGFFLSPYYPLQGFTRQARGTVAFDAASRRLTFTPEQPMAYGTRYTLVLTGVKDVAGNELMTKIVFMTAVNSVIRTAHFNTAYQPLDYVTNPLDANGFPKRAATYTDPFTDTFWFTNDDRAGSEYEFGFTDDGHMTNELIMAPGDDTMLNSPDDVATDRFASSYTADGLPKEHSHYLAGDDTMVNSPDDVIDVFGWYAATGTQLTTYTLVIDPGTDATFGTDDKCAAFVAYSYDTAGNRLQETLKGCGTDELSNTIDDEFARVIDYRYNANGYLVKYGWRTDPGMDTMWMTEDDVYSNAQTYQLDASGLVTVASTIAPFTDGKYFTPDDVITQQVRTTYNANKQPIEIVTYVEDGLDDMWGTNEDVIGSIQTFTYDSNGYRTDSKLYAAGNDGLWRTPDDVVITDYDYDLTH